MWGILQHACKRWMPFPPSNHWHQITEENLQHWQKYHFPLKQESKPTHLHVDNSHQDRVWNEDRVRDGYWLADGRRQLQKAVLINLERAQLTKMTCSTTVALNSTLQRWQKRIFPLLDIPPLKFSLLDIFTSRNSRLTCAHPGHSPIPRGNVICKG